VFCVGEAVRIRTYKKTSTFIMPTQESLSGHEASSHAHVAAAANWTRCETFFLWIVYLKSACDVFVAPWLFMEGRSVSSTINWISHVLIMHAAWLLHDAYEILPCFISLQVCNPVSLPISLRDQDSLVHT
jgi:hypothetical protein